MLQRYLFLLCCLVIFTLTGIAQQPASLMSPDRWTFPEGTVTFINHQGTPALQILNNSRAVLKDVTFSTGTIEFDFAVANSMFSGIYFRTSNMGENEHFYLRPFKPENRLISGAVQYTPIVRDVSLWDLFYPYQGSAYIKTEGWNHVKLEVSKKRLRATVNGEVVLRIPELLTTLEEGGIALGGNGIYANLTITPGQPANLPDMPAPDLTLHDPRYLRQWVASPEIPLPRGVEVYEGSLPDSTTTWTPLKPERFGLLNLTRAYSASKDRNDRRFVWLKTTIHSETDQTHRLRLGFNDEVWVFLNGQLIFMDQNRYARASQKQPDGRCDLDNAAFDLNLQEGANELIIGVANEFFGWGMMARLDSTSGLTEGRDE